MACIMAWSALAVAATQHPTSSWPAVVLDGDVSLRTVADVSRAVAAVRAATDQSDLQPGSVHINGFVWIEGSELTDEHLAEYLSLLSQINGAFVVTDTEQVHHLDSLSQLRKVRGSVTLRRNKALSSACGLAKIAEPHLFSAFANVDEVKIPSHLFDVEGLRDGTVSCDSASVQPAVDLATAAAVVSPVSERRQKRAGHAETTTTCAVHVGIDSNQTARADGQEYITVILSVAADKSDHESKVQVAEELLVAAEKKLADYKVDCAANATQCDPDLEKTLQDEADGTQQELAKITAAKPRDTDFEAYGPNGRGCRNEGFTVDSIEFDFAFTCDCSATRFKGDNCEVDPLASSVPLLHAITLALKGNLGEMTAGEREALTKEMADKVGASIPGATITVEFTDTTPVTRRRASHATFEAVVTITLPPGMKFSEASEKLAKTPIGEISYTVNGTKFQQAAPVIVFPDDPDTTTGSTQTGSGGSSDSNTGIIVAVVLVVLVLAAVGGFLVFRHMKGDQSTKTGGGERVLTQNPNYEGNPGPSI